MIYHMGKVDGILMKKIRRQFLSNWKQFLAIIAIGSIAVTLFVGLLSNAQSFSNRVETLYQETSAPDIYVTTSSYDENDINNIPVLFDKDNDQIESRFQMVNSLNGRSAYAIVSPELPTLSKPIDIEEKSSLHSEDYFFLIDQAYYDDLSEDQRETMSVSYDLSSYIDSSITSLLSYLTKRGGENFLSEKEFSISYPLTGTMHHCENITTSSWYQTSYLISKKMFREKLLEKIEENYNRIGVALIRSFLSWGEDESLDSSFPQANQYLIKLENSSTLKIKENRIKAYFAQKGENSNLYAVSDRESNPWSAAVDNDVKQASQLTFVFPFVFFLVALLVILTTFSQIVLKERGQIGTMKAIGLKEKEILAHYLWMVSICVVISTLIGCIVGPILIPWIMGMKYSILYTLPARSFFVFPWWQSLLTFLLFLTSSILVTYFVCRKSLKLKPSESMRPAPIRYQSKLFFFKGKKKPSATSLAIKMALRNIKVSIKKSAMVILGVAGCTALLVCGFGIDNTLSYGIDTEITTSRNADVSYSYSNETSSHKEELLSKYLEISKIEEYYSLSSTSISCIDENGIVSKSINASLRLLEDDYSFFGVEIPKEGKQVALAKKSAEDLGVNVGDSLQFSLSGEDYTCQVGVIYDAFSGFGLWGYFSDYPEFKKTYKAGFIDLKDPSKADIFASELKEESYIGSSLSKASLIEEINSVISGISIITAAVKVFAILLAIVVLYNLALLNFNERQRDIATLKVLGFSIKEIALSLVLETMILTSVGVLIGMGLGYPFMVLVMSVNQVSLVDYLYHIYVSTYFIAFAITFGVGLVVSIYLASLSRRTKMVESLKSVE